MSVELKKVYVVIGMNLLDGVYCNGAYESWNDAAREVGNAPEYRRIKEVNYFPAVEPPKAA